MLHRYFAASFFDGLGSGIYFPVLVLWLLEQGVSLPTLGILLALDHVAAILFEVPSGIVADQYGRKIALSLGAFLSIFGLFSVGFGSSVFYFALGMILTGLGRASISGADDAFVYDSLVAQNKQSESVKHFGRSQMIEKTSHILGALGSSLVVGLYSLKMTFVISPALIFIALCLYLSLREPKVHKESLAKQSGIGHLADSIKVIKDGSTLFLIVIVLTLWTPSPNEFIQAILKDLMVNPTYFGVIYASFNLLGLLGAASSRTIHAKWGMIRGLFVSELLRIFCYLIILLHTTYSTVLAIAATYFLGYVQRPMKKSLINEYIPSPKRATILSITNLTSSATSALILPIMGAVADIRVTYVFGASIALRVIVLGLLIKLRRYQISPKQRISPDPV